MDCYGDSTIQSKIIDACQFPIKRASFQDQNFNSAEIKQLTKKMKYTRMPANEFLIKRPEKN